MTTTVTEAFDAPMSDSGDVDVSMFHGVSASDSWLSVEASMGDDGFIADPTPFAYSQEDVEIEMGDDDEPITEYEMADEGVAYEESELQDVEVYDVSQAPSPFLAEHHAVDTEPMHMPSFDSLHPPTLEAHLAPAEPLSSFTEIDPSSSIHYPHDGATPMEPLPPPHSLDTASFVVDATPAPPLHEPPSQDHLATAEPSVALEQTGTFDAPNGDAEQDSVELPVQDSEYLPSGLELPQNDATEGAGPHGLDPPSATVEANDPHEISEGVYIDPPPPVLLSLPPSATHAEYSLFNFPTARRSHSPSGSNQPDTGNGLALLLQDRPTLYYEPLSAVFVALRQEQCIQSLPQFSEAELVLDAFDLQLSVSEDNVYAHEVTLHELDVIHDGSDIKGPLRLRLKLLTPRFVTRYNALRDQIARLTVEEDDQGHADTIPAQPVYDEDYTEHADAPEESYAEGGIVDPVQEGHNEVVHTEHDAPVEGEEQSQESNRATVHTVTDHAASESHEEAVAVGPDEVENAEEDTVPEQPPAEEQTVDSHTPEHVETAADPANTEATEVAEVVEEAQEVVEGAVGAQENVEGAAEEALEESAADGVAPHYQGGEETLDEPGAEEGGDYADHDQFPDDDDFDDDSEEFGEDQHGETRDDATAVPEVADEEYAEEPEYALEDVGLHTVPDTDAVENPNSVQTHEDVIYANEDAYEDYSTRALESLEDPAFPPELNELNDDWDDDEDEELSASRVPSNNLDALSRKSSSATLSSRASKRAYDEVDLQDFDDDDDDFGTAPNSPDAKRLRVE